MNYKINTNREEFLTSLESEIDFNDDYDIHDYLGQKINNYYKRGFLYINQEDSKNKNSFVITHSNKKLNLQKISKTLRALKFGDKNQLEP